MKILAAFHTYEKEFFMVTMISCLINIIRKIVQDWGSPHVPSRKTYFGVDILRFNYHKSAAPAVLRPKIIVVIVCKLHTLIESGKTIIDTLGHSCVAYEFNVKRFENLFCTNQSDLVTVLTL